jgi:hypothetical protein
MIDENRATGRLPIIADGEANIVLELVQSNKDLEFARGEMLGPLETFTGFLDPGSLNETNVSLEGSGQGRYHSRDVYAIATNTSVGALDVLAAVDGVGLEIDYRDIREVAHLVLS